MSPMLMELGNPDRESKIHLNSGAIDHMVCHNYWPHCAISIKLRPILVGICKNSSCNETGAAGF